MRISDWSSDVCSSDLRRAGEAIHCQKTRGDTRHGSPAGPILEHGGVVHPAHHLAARPVVFGNAYGVFELGCVGAECMGADGRAGYRVPGAGRMVIGGGGVQRYSRSEEHTSELQSLM